MPQQNRQQLKQEFQDGERPSGQDFADFIDSGINQLEDGVVIDADRNVSLDGGLTLGNPTTGTEGMLRFDGGVVQIHDGTTWGPLVPAVGPGGAFQEVGGGPSVAFSAGNVGIGTNATAPTFRLQVELDANTGENQQVRFGNVALANGAGAFSSRAFIAHRNQLNNNNYALAQNSAGETYINAANLQSISLRQNGDQVRLAVTSAGRVIVGNTSEIGGSTLLFQVNGGAGKTVGGGSWDTISDLRLKTDVRDLDHGLAELMAVRPVRFRYNGKAGTQAGAEHYGIIGQEMEQVFPTMVSRVSARIDDTEVDDMRLYNDSDLTYVMVNAIKELARRVEQLEAELAAHRGQTTDD